jgi:hypothetical protein
MIESNSFFQYKMISNTALNRGYYLEQYFKYIPIKMLKNDRQTSIDLMEQLISIF